MNNEELMMNNEKYKCFEFDVGAGDFVSAQIDTNKFDAFAVGACIARPQENKNNAKGITLIALIITIIIMLILAGITLNLTLGEHGIFKTARDASDEYSKQEAKERLELVLLDMQAEKITNSAYNENEYLTKKIEENDMKVDGNTVTVGKWKFEIDRSVPQISGNGQVDEESKEIVRTGLIAWYDGIENTDGEHSYDTTTWKDLSGNNASGATINGATWTKDGLYFDGSNDWVNMNSILMPETDNFTIDMVFSIFVNKNSGGNYILAQNNEYSTSRTGIGTYNNEIGVWGESCTDASQITVYKAKMTEKINVVFARNKDIFEIWVNGKKEKEYIKQEATIAQVNTVLGRWGLNNELYFNGTIHSIKAYDKALDNQEIMQNYKVNNNKFNIEEKIGNEEIVTQGLIAWYDGIENTDGEHDYDTTTWKDISGNNVQGATINGATWTPNGLLFDGNDWVNMNSILMPETNNFTIDIIATISQYGGSSGNYILAQNNSSGNSSARTGIGMYNTEFGIFGASCTDGSPIKIFIPKLAEKINIMIRKNEDRIEVWINEKKEKEYIKQGATISQVNTVLGRWGLYNGYYFNGIIHSVKSYDRALNSNEITQNYNANKLRFNI